MAVSYPNAPGVTFKFVPGTDIYCVGDDGSLWSRYGGGSYKLFGKWRRLKPFPNRKGHLTLRIMIDGKATNRYVHRLVLMTFVGPCPPGMMACHNDGNAANNRLSNLRWDTHKANIRDALTHGAYPVGSRRRTAKLTELDIPKIREMLASGLGQRAVGVAFKVDQKTISRIANRENWKHVP